MWFTISYLLYSVLVAVSFILAYGIYNIYLHPLRNYPGPKLWAAYRIPYVVKYMQGVLPYKVLEFHRRYGPVIRIAPDELAFADPAAWHDIYGMGPNRQQNPMDQMTFTPEQPGMENSFAGATDAVHTRLRRIYAPAFSLAAVERVSETFSEFGDLLVSRLKAVISEPPSSRNSRPDVVDIHEWYNFVSFDTVGKFAFGESFHCLDEARSHFFMKTIIPGIAAGSKMNQLERYGVYSALKPLIPQSALQAQIDLMNYVKELVDRRLEQDHETRTDVFHYLAKSELSKDALHQNAVIIVMAGSNTVATTLAAATYFLCRHPDKLKRVQDEIRTCFKSDDEITSKAVQQLPFLDGVLQETLRLVPGSGFGNPRWIRSKGGQSIAGHHVPENTRCSAYHYAMFRYDNNFTRPDDFIPERWLPDAPKECSQDDRQAFEPFGVGPRGCIGKAFANVQVRMIFVKMVLHFDSTLADLEELWSERFLADPLWEKPPLMVRLKHIRN